MGNNNSKSQRKSFKCSIRRDSNWSSLENWIDICDRAAGYEKNTELISLEQLKSKFPQYSKLWIFFIEEKQTYQELDRVPLFIQKLHELLAIVTKEDGLKFKSTMATTVQYSLSRKYVKQTFSYHNSCMHEFTMCILRRTYKLLDF